MTAKKNNSIITNNNSSADYQMPYTIDYGSLAAQNPLAAVLAFAGDMYARNYHERGIKKSNETANELFNEYMGIQGTGGGTQGSGATQGTAGNDSGVLKDTLAGTGITPIAPPNRGVPAQQSQPAPEDLVQQAIRSGALDKLRQQGENTISADSVAKAQGGGSTGQTPASVLTPTPQEQELDHAVAKWEILNQKYADSPNPVTDRKDMQGLTASVEQGLSRIPNMQNFNKAEFRNALMQKLMDDGRTPLQREQAWKNLEPLIDAKQKQYNDQRWGELNSTYQGLMMNGDITRAQALIPEMYRMNPELTKISASGNPTRSDLWKMKNQYGLLGYRNSLSQENRRRQADLQYQYTIANGGTPKEAEAERLRVLAGGRAGGSRSGGGRSGAGDNISSQQRMIWENTVKRGDNWVAAHSGKTIKDWEDYDQYVAAKNNLYRAGGLMANELYEGDGRTNYYEGIRDLTELLKSDQKFSREAIEKALHIKYGDLADKLIEDADWEAFGYKSNKPKNTGSGAGVFEGYTGD